MKILKLVAAFAALAPVLAQADAPRAKAMRSLKAHAIKLGGKHQKSRKHVTGAIKLDTASVVVMQTGGRSLNRSNDQ